MKTDVCIIGAGPAGLMAAIGAAREGILTLVVEQNANAGHKLLATGGGRCNFTHAASVDELVRAFGAGGRFLRHAFYAFKPEKVRDFFATRGVPSMVEPDGCVFPSVGRASDVRNALRHEAEKHAVQWLYGRPVAEITRTPEGFTVTTDRHTIAAHRVVIATGGLSWPQTGATGDGYRFAQALGHLIVTPKPALVPLMVREKWPHELAGISLPDIVLRTTVDKHRITTRGHLVFTYDGLGGPAPQDMSRFLTDALAESRSDMHIRLDLLPTWDEPTFDRRLQTRLNGQPKRTVANALAEFLPRRLAVTVCFLAECNSDLKANQISKALRRRLVGAIKSASLTIIGTRPIAEATVTRGGIDLSSIKPHTMESKICPGLYFAGEVIDADGPCGGYNLQMCFSTGLLAGVSAADSLINPHPSAT